MTYPFIEGSKKHQIGPQTTITRIVIHGTVSPCTVGDARNVARYFQSDTAGGLAHFVVDPGEIIQCCAEDIACWHAPPNMDSLGVELCDPQSGDTARWGDAAHSAMLHLAATLVADLCHRHNVPVAYVNAAGLLAGQHGITEHADVSAAFHQSSHTDPGAGFPMAHFISLVKAAAPVTPTPTPAPTPVNDTKDTDMATIAELRTVVQEEVAKAMAASHAEHVLLMHGDATHPHSIDSIAKKVGA
jgi:N-acetylmuramoyl-L-alanine amidase CwlA